MPTERLECLEVEEVEIWSVEMCELNKSLFPCSDIPAEQARVKLGLRRHKVRGIKNVKTQTQPDFDQRTVSNPKSTGLKINCDGKQRMSYKGGHGEKLAREKWSR